MASSAVQVNPEQHILLDQPLLRVPQELLRKTFKTSQKHIERDTTYLLSTLKECTKTSLTASDPAPAAIESLDQMISRFKNLKRKVESLRSEEVIVHEQSKRRLEHLDELFKVEDLTTPAYTKWSGTRLDRMLVDYMVRQGFGESAKALAEERGITDLVDIDVFLQCAKIAERLRGGSIQECLAWCNENKTTLKKLSSNLEYELRLQSYIELVRVGQKIEAIAYYRKYMANSSTPVEELRKAAALLAYQPDTPYEPYKSLYAASRWQYLSEHFIRTHHHLFSLPTRPLLQISLTAGLSCLKTPACHNPPPLPIKAASGSSSSPSGRPSSPDTPTANFHSTAFTSPTQTLCPICSTELNELAKVVPYAHHTKSAVASDPVVLPNMRVYGREQLEDFARRIGMREGWVRDPVTGEEWEEGEVRAVFIS